MFTNMQSLLKSIRRVCFFNHILENRPVLSKLSWLKRGWWIHMRTLVCVCMRPHYMRPWQPVSRWQPVEVPWYSGLNPWLWIKGLRVWFLLMPGTFVAFNPNRTGGGGGGGIYHPLDVSRDNFAEFFSALSRLFWDGVKRPGFFRVKVWIWLCIYQWHQFLAALISFGCFIHMSIGVLFKTTYY